MENLTTESSLRSLDELGRPLTAGRLSLPSSGSNEFEGYLERAREDSREQERIAERRSVRKGVSKSSASESRAEQRPRQAERSEDSERPAIQNEEIAEGDTQPERTDQALAESTLEEGFVSQEEPETDANNEHVALNLSLVPPTDQPLSIGLAQTPGVAEQVDEALSGKPLDQQGQQPPAESGSPVLSAPSDPSLRPTAIQPAQAHPNASVPELRPNPESGPRGTEQAPQTSADPERIARAESILNQVRLRLAPGLRSATLALHPAELGRVQVLIEVESGSVSAELRVESTEALSALERHIPELRALLSKDGQEVGTIELNLTSLDSSGDEPSQDPNHGTRGGSAPSDSKETTQPIPSLAQSLTEATGIDFLA